MVFGSTSFVTTIADGYSSKNGGIGSNPDIFADVDGSIAHTLTLGWVKVVINGCQHDVVTYECTLIDSNATLILELTAHVNEDPLTNDGVLAAIGMKRRKHAYRLGYLTPPKLLQQIVQLLWCVILAVNPPATADETSCGHHHRQRRVCPMPCNHEILVLSLSLIYLIKFMPCHSSRSG